MHNLRQTRAQLGALIEQVCPESAIWCSLLKRSKHAKAQPCRQQTSTPLVILLSKEFVVQSLFTCILPEQQRAAEHATCLDVHKNPVGGGPAVWIIILPQGARAHTRQLGKYARTCTRAYLLGTRSWVVQSGMYGRRSSSLPPNPLHFSCCPCGLCKLRHPVPRRSPPSF